MKRLQNLTVILVVVLLACTCPAKAGDKLGVRAGFHSAALYDDGNMLASTTHLQSFYFGLFKDNKIIPLLSLGTGLEYFQNGGKVDDDNKLVLHYLSVPVNVKAKVGPVFALTGLAPSIKISEKQYIAGQKSTPDDKSKVFDAPFFLGAGIKIAIVSIEARYHWGLIEIDDGVKNQYLQIGAGISF